MNVRILIGATAAYACIEVPGRSLDVLLHGAMSAPKSLRKRATEWRDQAEQLIKRAELIEAAADQLESKE